MLALRQEEVRRLAKEFGGADVERSLHAVVSVGKL